MDLPKKYCSFLEKAYTKHRIMKEKAGNKDITFNNH